MKCCHTVVVILLLPFTLVRSGDFSFETKLHFSDCDCIGEIDGFGRKRQKYSRGKESEKLQRFSLAIFAGVFTTIRQHKSINSSLISACPIVNRRNWNTYSVVERDFNFYCCISLSFRAGRKGNKTTFDGKYSSLIAERHVAIFCTFSWWLFCCKGGTTTQGS